MSGFSISVTTQADGHDVYNNSTTPPTLVGTVRVMFPSGFDDLPRYVGRGVGEYSDIDTGPRSDIDTAQRLFIEAVRSRQP